MPKIRPLLLLLILSAAGCAVAGDQDGGRGERTIAFVGARLIDGTGAAPVEDAVLLVRGSRVAAVGPRSQVSIPDGAEQVDVAGRTIVPGLINTHGHVSGVLGLETGPQFYTRDNILRQLALYARYGITTVVSLGDDGEEGIRIRDEQDDPALNRARLFVAGPVLAPERPEQAAAAVQSIVELGGDWVKIRVDDGLGQREKMPEPVYREVVAEAHRHGLPLAAHVVYLEDAKGVVRSGADFVAHSVRDLPVDAELIGMMRERGVCLSPTLTREVSTFVYASRPQFFDDPFFLKDADPAVLAQLQEPERQRRMAESASARWFEQALPLAKRNLKALSDAGVGIAFGTDTGPAARFQGYFEHMEMAMMAEAGLTPAQILHSATGGAARCVRLNDVGTLEPGKMADFVVLLRNPLDDIANMRTIQSVWISGNAVPPS
jgi:imidazolonepropionase-like amidohydrolase